MRLYPVACTVENKYSGTKALILSKFCVVALGLRGGGGMRGGWAEINKAENLVLNG